LLKGPVVLGFVWLINYEPGSSPNKPKNGSVVGIVGDALEEARIVAKISKSVCTPRPKKENQVMVPIRMSPRNPLRSKLSMEEKGKTVTIEIDEGEEDLEDLIITEDEDEGMAKDTWPAHA